MWRKDAWLTKHILTVCDVKVVAPVAKSTKISPRFCSLFQINIAFNHHLSLGCSGIFTAEADQILSTFREKTFDKLTLKRRAVKRSGSFSSSRDRRFLFFFLRSWSTLRRS